MDSARMETTAIASKPWRPPDCARAIADIEALSAISGKVTRIRMETLDAN